ncbi:MAG: TldD/PmbA family protein, partial [Bacilli bacterium]
MKKISTLVCIALLILVSPSQAQNDEHFVDLLKKELKQQMKELSSQKDVPYYMNYRVLDAYDTSVSSSFGAVVGK